jgi:hypothetical protein
MPRVCDSKTLKLKQCDMLSKVRCNLIAMVWKDKRCAHIDKYAETTTENNFYNEQGKAEKPVIIDYKQHMDYVN